MSDGWLPSVATFWRAVEFYQRQAYGLEQPPAAVRQRLEECAGEGLWKCASLEKAPHRYALRLGNPWYPHMKLAVERAPDGEGHLFRVDTHDRHIRPAPDSREYAAFVSLQERNLRLAESIESAWAEAGLMTFKEYLRRDLERRQVSM